jgi:organic hydroperoxide reductase OsmC/OhrA
MGKYAVSVVWQKKPGESFLDNKYSRAHVWSLDGGMDIVASSSPHIVPVPMSVTEAIDPEEAFVASIASCHMLWFLSIASERQFVVERYDDPAVGTLGKNAAGKLAMTELTLNPRVKFSGDVLPSPACQGPLYSPV